MTEQSRLNLLALVDESTEGTLVAPSSGTEFLPIREGAAVETGQEILANDELRSSLAPSQSQRGIENPSMEVPLYLKHSGVEGQAPSWATLLESLMGNENVNSTERATTSGSTTTVVNLASGGTDFDRGRAILLKDTGSQRNYSIRAVHSVATNALTLGFALSNAPATGMNVGKCVSYEPASTGHPSYSLWHYIANRAAIEALSGCRTDSLSIVATLGQEIEMNYTVMGLKYLYNPLIVTSSNKYIEFEDDDNTQRTAEVQEGAYRNPHDLATAIQTAMNLVGENGVNTVTYNDSDGKFTITSDASNFEIFWKTGTTHGSDNGDTHIGSLIGFSDSADDTGATSYTADSALSFVAGQTPSFDAVQPLVAKNMELMIGGQTDNVCLDAFSFDMTVSNNLSNKESFCAETGVKNKHPTTRTTTVSVTAHLDQYDADKIRRYVDNVETRMQLSFGEKVNGNWQAGKCGYIYLASCAIENFNISDDDGLAVINLEITAFADRASNGETYIGFL